MPSPLPGFDPFLLCRIGPGTKHDQDWCGAEPPKGMRHASGLRERSYFSPCGGRVEGARSACVAWAGDAVVVSDVAKGLFEGAPSIAFGIGTPAWTGAVDEARIEGVGRVSVLEARADPRPVLA